MADTDKNKLLRELYYDPDDGFMSTSNLYKDAHAKDPSITTKYVTEWLKKQTSIQTHKKCKWCNCQSSITHQGRNLCLEEVARSKIVTNRCTH